MIDFVLDKEDFSYRFVDGEDHFILIYSEPERPEIRNEMVFIKDDIPNIIKILTWIKESD